MCQILWRKDSSEVEEYTWGFACQIYREHMGVCVSVIMEKAFSRGEREYKSLCLWNIQRTHGYLCVRYFVEKAFSRGHREYMGLCVPDIIEKAFFRGKIGSFAYLSLLHTSTLRITRVFYGINPYDERIHTDMAENAFVCIDNTCVL